ncbi:ComF family protein [Patescibacteria group bacterium]
MKSFLKKHVFPTYNGFLNFLFPVFCIGCKKYNEILCNDCAAKITRTIAPQKYSWIYPLFDYRNKIIKKVIWRLKYREKTMFAEPLAELLYEHILDELQDMHTFGSMERPLIIPIPLSTKGLAKRGYNQSALIAKHLSFIDDSSFKLEKDVLYKTRDTKNQMEIKDRKKRLQNLHGCFEVKNPERVLGRNIILIDDVVTTGATLREAKRVLKKSGAKKVTAFTIAH